MDFKERLKEIVMDLAYENEGQYHNTIYELEKVIEEIDIIDNDRDLN